MNTHYAVLVFSGDYDNDNPDPELRGKGPDLTLIAAGPEEHCWTTLAEWTEKHGLRRDEHAEVLTRCPSAVRPPPSTLPSPEGPDV